MANSLKVGTTTPYSQKVLDNIIDILSSEAHRNDLNKYSAEDKENRMQMMYSVDEEGHSIQNSFDCHDVAHSRYADDEASYLVVVPYTYCKLSAEQIAKTLHRMCAIIEEENLYAPNTMLECTVLKDSNALVIKINKWMASLSTKFHIVLKLCRLAAGIPENAKIESMEDIIKLFTTTEVKDKYIFSKNEEKIMDVLSNIEAACSNIFDSVYYDEDDDYEENERVGFLDSLHELSINAKANADKKKTEKLAAAKLKKQQDMESIIKKYKFKTQRPVRVFSRHPTHEPLRQVYIDFRTLVRLGSTTPTPDKGNAYIEVNTVEAIQNSASKIRMKKCFAEANVKTAVYIVPQNNDDLTAWLNGLDDQKFIIKSEFGSRGEGLHLMENKAAVLAFFNLANRYGRYIVEKFYNYNREYRLHVTAQGCFYTCRKMLKQDTPADKRWFRNDSNSVWIMEENPSFEKPVNWKVIEEQCIKALKATGLDVGACDVRVQSATDAKGRQRENPDFIICEINSAPSFGEQTLVKYQQIVPQIVEYKLNQLVSNI